MKKMKKQLAIAILCLSGVATASVAVAGSPAVPSAKLEQSERVSLEKAISEAHVSHPDAFDAVREVDGYRPEVYRKFRNPKPHVAAQFRSLGPDALMPMLDELSFNQRPRADSTDEEWGALRVGLLEAVGSQRDQRSIPVLRTIFLANETRGIANAAGRALGKVCGDDELSLLRDHTGASDPLRSAAIEGLGECRKVASAEVLAKLLTGAHDDAEVVQISHSLGVIGSSWAWKTLGPAVQDEGLEVRRLAAAALVPAYVAHSGNVRKKIGANVLMLDHPALPQSIEDAKAGANEETQRDLGVLSGIVKKHLATSTR